jgi:hypothetical protein
LTRSFRAACACRSGYEGDPYTGCRRSECVGKFHSSSIASNKLQHHDEIWSRSEQKTPNAPAIRSATTSVASIHARPLAVSTPNVPFAITSPFASAPRDSPVIHSSPALHHPAPMSLAARVWITFVTTLSFFEMIFKKELIWIVIVKPNNRQRLLYPFAVRNQHQMSCGEQPGCLLLSGWIHGQSYPGMSSWMWNRLWMRR